MSNGINLSKLHESESVTLLLSSPLHPKSIAQTLGAIGFEYCDDFCFLPRSDTAEQWQSSNIATVTFFQGDTEVNYYFDDVVADEPLCDRLVFEYLFASLPPCFIKRFLDIIRESQLLLLGVLEHRGRHTDIQSLEVIFGTYLDEVGEELAEKPGSEFLARIISDFYPRP